jgi:hypothetical protein
MTKVFRRSVGTCLASLLAAQLVVADASGQEVRRFDAAWILDVESSDAVPSGRDLVGVPKLVRLDAAGMRRLAREQPRPLTESQMAERDALLEAVTWRPNALRIEQSTDSIVLTVVDGSREILIPDEVEQPSIRGGVEIGLKTKASDEEIRVEYRGPTSRVERRFKLKDNGETLEVFSTFRSSRLNADYRVKQVYRRNP